MAGVAEHEESATKRHLRNVKSDTVVVTMAAKKHVAITEEIHEELQARKQSEYEPYHEVISRALADSEGNTTEREDSATIAEEITTAMANGDVPVVLADGEAERIAREVDDV